MCSNHPLPCRGLQGFSQCFALHGPCYGAGALLRARSSVWAGSWLVCLGVTLGLHSPALHSWLALDHVKGNMFNQVPKGTPATNHSSTGTMSSKSGSSSLG